MPVCESQMPAAVDLDCGVVHALLDSLEMFVGVERFVVPGNFSRCNVMGVWGGECLWSTRCARPRTMSECEAFDVCDAVVGV